MTAKLTLPLEVGKKYVRRDGQIVTLTKGPGPNFPFGYATPDGDYGNLTPTGRWSPARVEHAADLVADYFEPAKTQGHPHAESMRLYAEDAAECAEPWTRWEVCLSGEWEGLTTQPSWAPHFQYRRKRKTVRVGAFDVPEPMREAPPVDTVVFVVVLTSACTHLGFFWSDSADDKRRLKRGLLHSTHEAADLHAKALLSLTEAHNG